MGIKGKSLRETQEIVLNFPEVEDADEGKEIIIIEPESVEPLPTIAEQQKLAGTDCMKIFYNKSGRER